MNKTSIILLSYNTHELTKTCIESIRRFTPPGWYEIIVVDNASTDASPAWLKEQKDVRLILNDENKGFPAGCNQGMEIAAEGNDILLLNSDTIVTPRWLVNLQQALYSSYDVGAVSCMTNCCSNFQTMEVEYNDLEGLMKLAEQVNHSNPALWEKRILLIGFCLLIKNAAFRQVGFLDEAFSPGNCEDDDYCLRLVKAGYTLLLCRDTFIHHYGGASFGKRFSEDAAERTAAAEKHKALIDKNLKILFDKWRMGELPRGYDRSLLDDLAELEDASSTKRILVIGCDAYYIMPFLCSNYPQARIMGVTEHWAEAAVTGRLFDVAYCPDTEQDIFVLLSGYYDYILLADWRKQYRDFDGYIERLMPYLAPGGSIHISK